MAINFGFIKIGQKYEFPVFKEVTAAFTATKNDTLLLDGGEVKIYHDPNHTQSLRKDGPTPEVCFSGYGNGGKFTFKVESGKNYYFWSGNRGCMNSKYILLTSVNNLELVSISPPEGSTFEISGYGASDITFNQPVNFESAFITFASKNIPVTPKKSMSSINAEIKNQLWELYKDGTINGEGQKFTLTIRGIKSESSTFYNGDGTLVVNYLTCQKPISIVDIQSPSVFRASFEPEEKDSIVVLTFDNQLDSKPPRVELHYGEPESHDFYMERMNPSIDGNKLSINLSGKRRTPKDMLRSGSVYPTIAIKVFNVHDSKGKIAWSDDQGSNGSFTINFRYQS